MALTRAVLCEEVLQKCCSKEGMRWQTCNTCIWIKTSDLSRPQELFCAESNCITCIVKTLCPIKSTGRFDFNVIHVLTVC